MQYIASLFSLFNRTLPWEGLSRSPSISLDIESLWIWFQIPSRHSPLTKSFWTTGKIGTENRCILFARNWSFHDFPCTTFQESDAPTRSQADSGELGSSKILSAIAAMTSSNEVLEQIEQLPWTFRKSPRPQMVDKEEIELTRNDSVGACLQQENDNHRL